MKVSTTKRYTCSQPPFLPVNLLVRPLAEASGSLRRWRVMAHGFAVRVALSCREACVVATTAAEGEGEGGGDGGGDGDGGDDGDGECGDNSGGGKGADDKGNDDDSDHGGDQRS